MSYFSAFTHAHWIALAVASIAMFTDLRQGRIFNWLTFPAILVGWAYNLATGGLSGFAYSFAATVLGIFLLFPLAVFGIIGMGDVKLLGAIGAIGGTSFVTSVFLYASALGFPHAVAVQLLNYGRDAFSMFVTSFSTKAFLEKTIHKENANLEKNKYRFLLGLDIFIGTLIACFYTITIKW